ncbi:MAG TPA: hypothetical protein VFU73_06750 [Actinocrinis sp.]|nr:hypothetical protein [Actinocrinis sp.]
MSWERWNHWTLVDLPELNRSVLSGREPAANLTAALRRALTDDLPLPETFAPDQAKRLLVLLGLAGSSVARHYQEADPARAAHPAWSFGRLTVGPAKIPFAQYFARLADASQTGHPPRDCYASLVRWNAPTTVVEADGEALAVLPGSFPDGATRTYTGDPGEIAFFALLKKSEALERAVNDVLEPVAQGAVGPLSQDAVDRALLATRLMTALIHVNQEFAAAPPEHGGLSTEHCLDAFRQFAVHWEVGDLPPAGAQDPEFIRRDLLLGIDFPGYAEHVRRIYPSLLGSEREMLDRDGARPALPESLLAALGIDPDEPVRCTRDRARELVRAHPQLAAWYLLLAANAEFGAVHLMLTDRILFKAQRERDPSRDGDRSPVAQPRDAAGIEEPLLVRLALARRNHALRGLGQLPHRELASACGDGAWLGGNTELDDDAADRLPTVRFAEAA